MIRNIRAELIKILDESDWMDDETKVVAKEKVINVILCINFVGTVNRHLEHAIVYFQCFVLSLAVRLTLSFLMFTCNRFCANVYDMILISEFNK